MVIDLIEAGIVALATEFVHSDFFQAKPDRAVGNREQEVVREWQKVCTRNYRRCSGGQAGVAGPTNNQSK